MQVAMGEQPPAGVIVAARALRDQDRPDLAAALLEREADLSDLKADLLYLRLLVDLDDHAALQAALQRSIQRLPERAALAPGYVRLLCRQALRACDESWLELLLRKTWKSCKADPQLLAAHRALGRRILVRTRMRASALPRASLISMGMNCMPWDIPSQWGLRGAEDFCALRTPFDSGANKLPLVLETLETDFAAYCTLDVLRSVETGGGHLTPMRKDVRAVWNHHSSGYWICDDFRRLRENMAAKVQAFRHGCRREDAVFVISHVNLDYPARPLDFLDRLNGGLERFTGSPRNRLVFINEYAAAAATTWVDDQTLILDRPFPRADYVWYDEATTDSAEGLQYEQELAEAIMAALSLWGLTSVGEAAPAPLAVPA